MNPFLRLGKQLKDIVKGKDLWQGVQVKRKCTWYGDVNAGFYVYPHFKYGEVMLSFGVGENTSFDEQVHQAHGLQVHLFDPTPRSVEFIKKKNLPAAFHFHAVAIWNREETLTFRLPENPAHVSLSVVEKKQHNGIIQLPAKRFATICQDLGLTEVALLKLDIEGAEYEVIPDILASGIRIKQIAIEFHHRFDEVAVSKTKAIIKQLNDHGFYICAISESREEYTFVRL